MTISNEAFMEELDRKFEAEARELRDSLQLTPGTLTERLSHGDFYHRRETASGPTVSEEDLRLFAIASPYGYDLNAEHCDRMLTEIAETSETWIGWSRFYLEPPASR
jgi:hypothetical protein